MKRWLVALILPLSLHLLLAAQQLPSVRKAVSPKDPALPVPTSTTAYDPYFSEGRGYWERNYLIYVHPGDVRVDLYDKDTLRSSFKVAVPNSNDVSLSDATVTEDGRLIVSGCYFPEKGQIHCFVGVANPDGQVSPMVDTGKFSPIQVSTCDGVTVWAIGWLRTGPDLDRESRDQPYHILREYSLPDGKMVHSTLERTTFAPWAPPALSGHDWPDLTMRCSGKVLGIYEGASDEWIEYNLSTSELMRWKLPKQDHPWAEQDQYGRILPKPNSGTRVTGIAMLDCGEVYASFRRHSVDKNQASMGLYRLEKVSNRGDWMEIVGTVGPADQPGAFERLNGTDGTHLVYSRFGERTWFFSSAPH
jgi:hypothetical protein